MITLIMNRQKRMFSTPSHSVSTEMSPLKIVSVSMLLQKNLMEITNMKQKHMASKMPRNLFGSKSCLQFFKFHWTAMSTIPIKIWWRKITKPSNSEILWILNHSFLKKQIIAVHLKWIEWWARGLQIANMKKELWICTTCTPY